MNGLEDEGIVDVDRGAAWTFHGRKSWWKDIE
jgi:hypothetical protein